MLAWSLYVPLLLAALVYVIIAISSSVVRSRGNDAGAEKLLDLGFLVAMAAGVWTLILLVLAIFDQPNDIWDMALIVIVVGVFFALLLGLLFGVFELIFSRGSGRRGAAPEKASSPDAS